MGRKSKIKMISVRDFQAEGYLQEVNRNFFHPLGLALSVEKPDQGEMFLNGIWDYRDDPEGIIYGKSVTQSESFKEKAGNISKEQKRLAKTRKKLLGYIIQPVNSCGEDG